MTGRRGASGSTTSPPAPRAGAAATRSTNADIDGDGAPDYRIPNIWEYTGTPLTANHPGFGSAALTTDLGKVIRYVGARPARRRRRRSIRRTSPPTACRARCNLDVNTVEGWNQVNASEDYVDTRSVPRRACKELPSRLRVDAHRGLPGHRDERTTGTAATSSSSPTRSATTTSIRATRRSAGSSTCSSSRRGNHDVVPRRRRPRTRQGSSTGRSAQKPKSPGLLGFADDNWLERDSERRLQLRVPGRRRERLRADDHDDPRVRTPLSR